MELVVGLAFWREHTLPLPEPGMVELDGLLALMADAGVEVAVGPDLPPYAIMALGTDRRWRVVRAR